jgi:hypothetical protein
MVESRLEQLGKPPLPEQIALLPEVLFTKMKTRVQ